MNGMTYKGYAARVEFDAEDHIFVGHIIGIRDIVGFHGETVSELGGATGSGLTYCYSLAMV
jgi:predicted HicB family RNase H-like nuclease